MYIHKEIEKKWQNYWEENKTFKTENDFSKPKYYCLDMFPFPSGAWLHVGHPEWMTANDIIARYKHTNGYNVLHPMWRDAFWLPAENYAIKTGKHPKITTLDNIDNFRKQIKSLGFSYDWDREVDTTDPKYYKWTQWIFLKLFEKWLAYEQDLPINYCPSCKTWLANEEVLNDFTCERCGTKVEKKQIRQWVLSITKYAERLLNDVDRLDWPEWIKDMQRNWIWKSEGCEFEMKVFSENEQKKQTILLLHWWWWHDKENWFPWLKESIKSLWWKIFIPNLPNANNPNLEEQLEFIKDYKNILKEGDIIITLSLWSKLALAFLEKYQIKWIKVIFVAPTYENVIDETDFDSLNINISKGTKESLKLYNESKLDFEKINNLWNEYKVFLSKDDKFINFDSAKKYITQIKNFDLIVFENKWHFNETSWVLELPEILHFILEKEKKLFISVYTTRIDTVFSMAFVVIAPDHPRVFDFVTEENYTDCEEYIEKSNSKSDQDRTQTDKEKTWAFTGSYVINPYNNEKIPVWIWDFVLWHYGTWAVFGDAHDERDFIFAKKYKIPLKQSIVEKIIWFWDGKSVPIEWKKNVYKNWITAILLDEKEENILLLKYCAIDWISFITWWIEKGYSIEETLFKEIKEETGYTDISIKDILNSHYQEYYHNIKDFNWLWLMTVYVVKINSLKKVEISEKEKARHTPFWCKKEEVIDKLTFANHKKFIKDYFDLNYKKPFIDDWYLINSWKFDWLSSQEARKVLTKYAEEKWFWEKRVNFKLRDWLFSRQRYWGEPIPLIHCEKCWIVGEKEENLPILLPDTDNFEPSWDGTSPLSKIDSFVNCKCPQCGWPGKRETNTMPQWWGSCWYYLRYMDPNNSEKLVDREIANYWWEVDSYVWWAEHAVLHLLYARFWHKFLFDLWIVPTDEPFYRLRNQWLILAFSYQNKNGKLIANDLVEEKNWEFFDIETWDILEKVVAKMSKSLKNVVNPDEIVNEYGADSLRLYEMYMAEFKDAAPWDTKNIIWVRRFIEKSERLFTSEAKISNEDDNFTMKLLHKAIKKVQEDIENYKFNTAISCLMILVNNWLPKDKILQNEFKNIFVKLIHPFTPHLAEELWERIGEKESVFFSNWPKYDINMTIDDTIQIAVQVLGKVRWTIEIDKWEDKDSILEKAKNNKDVNKWIKWKEIVKEIYVPGKIVNIVIK